MPFVLCCPFVLARVGLILVLIVLHDDSKYNISTICGAGRLDLLPSCVISGGVFCFSLPQNIQFEISYSPVRAVRAAVLSVCAS